MLDTPNAFQRAEFSFGSSLIVGTVNKLHGFFQAPRGASPPNLAEPPLADPLLQNVTGIGS